MEHAMSQSELNTITQAGDGLRPRYSQLKDAGLAEYEKAGLTVLVIRNRISALNTYMKWCRRADGEVVGHEFGLDFDRDMMRWCDDMRRTGKAARTIQDRCGFLVLWNALLMRIAQTDTLPEAFPEALRDAADRQGMSYNALSKVSGIGAHAIGDWASGRRRPTRDVVAQIAKLETCLSLPNHTLARRLGFVIERHQVCRAAREQKNALTTYGKRLRAQYRSGVRLKYLKSPHDNVRKEWHLLMAHKVNEFRPRASTRDTWRIKSNNKTGNKGSWASHYMGQRVAAADAAWNYLSRYLSWTCLAEESGGAGIPEERISSLGWVLKFDLFQRCLQWVKMRSDNILHRGQAQMLNYACMLLRPETGWLWLNPQTVHSFDRCDVPIDADLDVTPAARVKELWQAECSRVWGLYKSQSEMVVRSPNLQMGRDPQEPISDILKLRRPLAAVMEMLVTLKRNPPPPNRFKLRAVWLRDILMISWLAANPLRAQHFSTMTHRSDQSGNLFKDGAVWYYRCTAMEFKNSPGDYQVTLPDFVGEAIEAYLSEGRQYLCNATGCDFVFLPSKAGPQTTTDATGTEMAESQGMWTTEALGIRVRLVTRGLRHGLPGFGPHAFRHIGATDFLKRYPGAYKLVAHLLNDTLATVIREYGHVSPQDGLELHYQSASDELRRANGESD
jgi:transcriptional regulator with XRE-family HTH domain